MADFPSWAWITGAPVTDNQASFVGYTFDPNAVYKEAPNALRDGDGTGGDGRISPRNSGFFHPNDGWAIDETAYNFHRNWTYRAEITYKDGTTATTTVFGSRLVEKNDDASADYHNTMLFRLPDAQILNVADGGTDDGDGEYHYGMDDIVSVTITEYVGQADWRAKKDLDNFWPEVVCFASGTFIHTANGPVAIENLREGDMILTRDNGLQPLRWIGSRKLASSELTMAPNLRPIRIQAGALGHKIPAADLTVSPQHRLLVRSKIAQRMFGTDEVLVAAKQLLEYNGIEIVEDAQDVEYFHILFDQHEIVLANGAEAESLYMGQQTLRTLSEAAREEIFTLFSEMRDREAEYVAPSARQLISGRPGRQLASRHVKNNLELVK